MLSTGKQWRVSPAATAHRVSKGAWAPARHLLAIDDAICDAVVEGGRVILEVPVRHGKSELGSFWTPTWFLENWPYKRVTVASYAAELAEEWGRKTRDTFIENQDLLSTRVATGSRKVKRWRTTKGGGMLTVGVGGSLTGWGTDLLVIDDPIKNAEEAESEVLRKKVWDWFRSTAYTRLEPGAAVVVIMARWHEDDLTGRILENAKEEGAEQWKVVRLPALAEGNDALGREPGEALWPERGWTADVLKRVKVGIGGYYFNALYQQRPSPPEGTILLRAWWQRWQELPRAFDMMLMSWDMSFTDKESSSYVVGQVWGRLGARMYLIDQVRGQWDFPTTKKQVSALAARYPHVLHKLIEDKANGPAIIAELKHHIPGIIAITPLISKIARARAAAGPLEAANVYIPAHAPWVDEFLEETATFPHATHDDQVDSFSQAVVRMAGGPAFSPDDYMDTRKN